MRARWTISSAWARAQSSVCSTSARAEFVSSVAWWAACSVSRLPRTSASRSSAVASRFDFVRISRDSLRAALRISGALPLGLLADAGDLGLLLLELHLLLADLLLGAADLLRGRVLGVALDRVGELGRGADDVQRVHADGMAGRLGARALGRRLEHAQVGLQGRDVPPEGVEGLLHLGAVVAVGRARQVLEPGQGRQARLGPTRFLRGHVRYASPPRSDRGLDTSMPFLIGWIARIPLGAASFRLHTQLNSKLLEQFLLDLRRRAAHRVDARLVLRERDHVAEVRLAAERHQHALDPERDPAVRRRAHGQRVEQEAELPALLLLA